MFDPISLGALGGASLLGTGLSVAGGLIQGSAARDAAGAQLGYLDSALQDTRQANLQQQALFSPYQLYGSGALAFLQSRMLTSNERQMASVQQRSSLQKEVERLSTATDWSSMPILTGEKASERRASLWQQMEFDRKQQLQTAQSRLSAFEQEQEALAPYQKEQDAYLKAKQGRVDSALERVSQASNFNLPLSLSQIRQDLTYDPVYQFRQEQGERAINRAAAARGNFMSGAALASIGDFNNQLTADETDRYFNRVLAGKTSTLQGAVMGLNAELGADQQEVNNLMGLSQIGLSAATSASNALSMNTQVQANVRAQQGQAQANGVNGQAAGLAQGLNSVAQTIGTGVGLGVMSNMMSTTPAGDGSTGVLSRYVRGGQEYLINPPR